MPLMPAEDWEKLRRLLIKSQEELSPKRWYAHLEHQAQLWESYQRGWARAVKFAEYLKHMNAKSKKPEASLVEGDKGDADH